MASGGESCKLNLISECYVKPAHEANDTPKVPRQLGVKDLFMLSMDPMQRGLLFNTKPHSLQSDNLPRKLKKALYVSLSHFYPLAGRLATQKFYDEHACSFYVDYDKGPGARLIHASVDLSVSDIVSSVNVHPIVDSFFDMGEKSVNYDGHTRPLLSVQVTDLIDGVFIGFTMNHCIADGISLWHFISTLSEIFTQIKDKNKVNANEVAITRKPIFTTLFPNNGHGPIFKLPYLEPDEFIFRYDPSPLRVRIFHFSPTSMSTIKAKANEECGLTNTISSFQALCGLVWRSITRARNLQSDLEVSYVVITNIRTRLETPLPPEYFRCLVHGVEGVSKVGDLLSNGIGRAGLLINQSIKMVDERVIRQMINKSEENPCIVQPGPQSVGYKPNGITIGGSSKFDTYGSEFGLGKAIATLAGRCSKVVDGKVVACQGREAGGSVDLEICLKPEIMDILVTDDEFMSFVSATCL